MPDDEMSKSTVTTDRVTEVVMRELAYLGVPSEESRNLDSHILDLLWDEDATMDFIPDVETALQVDIPSLEWESVYTLREAIMLLARYVDASES
jgi:acyl carrier protein